MKALKYILFTLSILALVFSCSYAINEPYNLQVKQLYSEPNGKTGKIVYQIPIDVKLLDVSEDANWYKVAIKFSLGIAEFKYSGWAYIPVGNILAERAQKNKLAAISK